MSATIDIPSVFESAVKCVLNSWTALQLAVSQGFGGVHSKDKAEWLIVAISTWFQQNDAIQPYELEEFLADVLNTEFDLLLEDGSLKEISQTICMFYRLSVSGKHNEVLERIQNLPKSDVTKCQQQPETQTEETVDDIDDDTEGGQSSPASTQVMNNTAESAIKVNDKGGGGGRGGVGDGMGVGDMQVDGQSTVSTKHSEEDMDMDDDGGDDGGGWTVVAKGKKR